MSAPIWATTAAARCLPRWAPLSAARAYDIFCKAIRLLPPEVREKASFLFVGQAADKEMMDSVRALTADYPENVFYCKRSHP